MTRLTRLYRALLYLYPAWFRDEYGEEMAAVFRHRTLLPTLKALRVDPIRAIRME